MGEGGRMGDGEWGGGGLVVESSEVNQIHYTLS